MSAFDITASIEAAMRERYCAPEWALLFNVGNGTGSRLRGWADAVAINMYPSRGLAIHGFEFKASRADWRKELSMPDKAENVARFCDYWWLVANEGITQPGELPHGWGHLSHKDGKLRVVVNATKLDAQPVTRVFLAAMLRRSAEADQAVIKKLVDQRIVELRKADQRTLNEAMARATKECDELKAKLESIREETGIDLTGYKPTKAIASTLKFATRIGVGQTYGGIADALRDTEKVVARLRTAFKEAGIVEEKP